MTDPWRGPRRTILRRFRHLEAPSPDRLLGSWGARFVGPAWVRVAAGPTVALAGMPGWTGKRFDAPDRAVNLVRRGDATADALPLELVRAPSLVDGRPAVLLRYGAAGAPWRWVVDELREVDDRTLLGVTVLDVPVLRRVAFPFLLERAGSDG